MGEQPVVPLAPRQPFFFFFWLEEGVGALGELVGGLEEEAGGVVVS